MTKHTKPHHKKNKPGFLKSPPERYWLFGKHACLAAIRNPKRNYFRILVTRNALRDLPELHGHRKVEEVEQRAIAAVLPKDAVHQGIAVELAPLPDLTLDELPEGKHIVVLDQITDPHNVGAMLRSAAAFNIGAMLTTMRHAPQETATLAKTACGALEIVPLIKVTNLSNTLEELKTRGYLCVGLAGEAEQNLGALKTEGRPIAFVMGAEGKGLRQRTRETCDTLVRIPMDDAMESLNVSNAAAICFYALNNQ